MKKRILLIDDESVPDAKEPSGNYMWYYAQALREQGYDLKEVTSTDCALNELATHTFDLVVLDIMMPPGKAFADADSNSGMRTGALLAEAIWHSYPRIPIVILSNTENQATVRELRTKKNVKVILFKSDAAPFAIVEELNAILGV